jgi:luciferase-like monooxygenase
MVSPPEQSSVNGQWAMSRSDAGPAMAHRYDRSVSRTNALVDEIANELDTWPGVRVERRPGGAALVRYEHLELGVLDHDRGVAELRFWHPEHEELVEHGDAEPASPAPESDTVRHAVEGPSDVTAVLELFDRRYRDARGEDVPYSSQDPA